MGSSSVDVLSHELAAAGDDDLTTATIPQVKGREQPASIEGNAPERARERRQATEARKEETPDPPAPSDTEEPEPVRGQERRGATPYASILFWSRFLFGLAVLFIAAGLGLLIVSHGMLWDGMLSCLLIAVLLWAFSRLIDRWDAVRALRVFRPVLIIVDMRWRVFGSRNGVEVLVADPTGEGRTHRMLLHRFDGTTCLTTLGSDL